MRGTCVKILMLVVLAIATSITTSTIAAKLKPKKQPAVATAKPLPPEVAAEKQRPTSRPGDGGASITSLKAYRVDGGLLVRGKAHVKNPSFPDQLFVWHVRVCDQAKTTNHAFVWYDQQVFRTPRDTHELEPVFDDVIGANITPGRYKIVLSLFEVPRDGVPALEVASVARLHLVGRKTIDVTFQ